MSKVTYFSSRRGLWPSTLRSSLFMFTMSSALSLLACQSNLSPVAPEGAVLTISANPSSIPVTGTSQITVQALNNGIPVRRGTEISLTTTLGKIENLVTTDDSGFAFAQLVADGREGDAEVKARSGQGTGGGTGMPIEVSANVEIGGSPSSLQAVFTPSTNETLTVFFDEASTGSPTSWQWDFGDGRGSNDREPTHTYLEAGSYVVVLTVRDPENQDSTSQTVIVPASQGSQPMADFSFERAELTVTFTDKSSGAEFWRWDFGDGNESATQNPVHTYAQSGNYSVTLAVRNAAGSDSKSLSVVVPESSVPDANFETREVPGLKILFRDTSTQSPTQWSWDFGDGGSSNQQNPEHVYPAVGVYTVTLVASNLAGSSSETKFIEVLGPLAADFEFTTTGLTAAFTDTSSGSPTTHEWDFGDGSDSVIESNPTHTYAEGGDYVVRLKVTRGAPGSASFVESTITHVVSVTGVGS